MLDFWTSGCINCIHILPELKKLEHQYAKELVVIGVHSAKFETEKGSENIEEAILRYEMEHPVVNDADHKIWDTYGVRSWPSVILIDPSGFAVWGRSGDLVTRTVDTHVSQVRKKLDLRAETGFRVVPIYNYGYRLEQIGEGASSAA